MNKKELGKQVASMILGDGCLRIWKGVENAGYNFVQIDSHEDYVKWQYEIVSQICKTSYRRYDEYIDKNNVHHKPSIRIETLSHPFFTTLRNRLYFCGRKTVSVHDLKNFDEQSACIWYMDDGYLLKSEDKSQRGSVFLCTDHYNHAEVILLQKVLYEKLNIPFNIRKRGERKDGGQIYRLVATKENARNFLEKIYKFSFPSFAYKFSLDEN